MGAVELAGFHRPERTERSCRKPCMVVVWRMNLHWIRERLARGASAARVIFASAARVILVFLRVVYRGEDSEPAPEAAPETAPEAAPKTGPMKVFWRPWSMTVGLLLILWVLDPIDVASNSARASAELFYRIISPAYPPAPENAGSGRESDDPPRIAVIIINDETLRIINDEARKTEEPKVFWPPPFSLHAKIIDKILIYNPKALFIDFGFFDERKDVGLDELVKALNWRLSKPVGTKTACGPLFQKTAGCYPDDGKVERKVPVFLAGAPRPFDRGEEPHKLEIIPALKAEVTGTVSTRYSTEHELPYNSYPLYDCSTRDPSAALAIYAAFHGDWTTWGLDRTPCPSTKQRTERDWAGGPNGM